MSKMYQGYYKCQCGDERCPNSIILYGSGTANYCCKLNNPKEDCEFWFDEEENWEDE